MAEKKTQTETQAESNQQTFNGFESLFGAFDPSRFTAGPFADMGARAFGTSVERMTRLVEESARLEAQALTQLRSGFEQYMTLANQQLDYNLKLAAEWRGLMLDNARKVNDAMSASA